MQTKNILLTGIFTALMIISSYVVIPIGPVPHSMQPLIVLLAGILLGARYGALSIIVWILLGCLGLPVFNQGQAGAVMLMGPTGGFILGFVVCAWLVGYLTERHYTEKLAPNIVYMILAMLIVYVVGIVGFKFNMEYFLGKMLSWEKSFILVVAPFLPFDIIKAAIASYVGVKVRRALKTMGLV